MPILAKRAAESSVSTLVSLRKRVKSEEAMRLTRADMEGCFPGLNLGDDQSLLVAGFSDDELEAWRTVTSGGNLHRPTTALGAMRVRPSSIANIVLSIAHQCPFIRALWPIKSQGYDCFPTQSEPSLPRRSPCSS